MQYPDEFLRGIPNEEKIDSNNTPSSDLFYFVESEQKNQRSDSFWELSINWCDDMNSELVLFSMKKIKNNIETLQFKYGAALMCRIEYDRLMKRPKMSGIISYERSPLDDNKYHGNLLMDKNLDKKLMRKISANIALSCFKELIINPNSI